MKAAIWLLALLSSHVVAAPPVEPIGAVVGTSGPTFVSRAQSAPVEVKVGDGVLPGDEFTTGDDAWLVISLPRSDEPIERIGANEVWRAEGGRAASIPWAPPWTGKRLAATSRGDQAAATLQLARSTRIAALPRRMSWRSEFPQLDTARIVLTERDGTPVASLSGRGHVDIPASTALSSDHLYCWRLQASDDDAPLARGSFALLAHDGVQRVQQRLDAETPPSDAVSGAVLVQVGVLVDEGLYVDAAQRLLDSDLARSNERLHERLLLELAALSSIPDPTCP